MTYPNFVRALPTPTTIDKLVFEPDSSASKGLCAFILALALIYDDLKGLAMAEVFLGDVKPATEGPTAERGEMAGMQLQGLRPMASLIHELLDLVSDNSPLLQSAEFRRVLKRASRDARGAWKTIVSATRADRSPTRAGECEVGCVFERGDVYY